MIWNFFGLFFDTVLIPFTWVLKTTSREAQGPSNKLCLMINSVKIQDALGTLRLHTSKHVQTTCFLY